MKLTSLLQLVNKLQQAGKIDNLQQAVAFLAVYVTCLWYNYEDVGRCW